MAMPKSCRHSTAADNMASPTTVVWSAWSRSQSESGCSEWSS